MADLMRRRGRPEALETAWKIHQAQTEWTGKVDTKAAFAFSVHSLLLTLSLAAVEEIREVYEWIAYGLGVAVLVAGAITAASVVAPSLKGKGLKRAARDNYIYFGHARHWNPTRLERELRQGDPLSQVARQITVMADIAWSKHVRVAWAIWLGAVGGILVLGAALLSRLS